MRFRGAPYRFVANLTNVSLDVDVPDGVYSAFTLAGWLRGVDYGTLCALNSDGDAGSGLGVNSSGYPEAKLVDQGSVKKTITATIGVLDDEWHFLAFVFDGNVLKLRVDDEETVTEDYSYSMAGTSTLFRIGEGTGVHWGYLNDKVAECIFFDRALSDSELDGLFKSPHSPPSGAVAYVRFISGKGDPVDVSGNPISYSGTLEWRYEPFTSGLIVDLPWEPKSVTKTVSRKIQVTPIMLMSPLMVNFGVDRMMYRLEYTLDDDNLVASLEQLVEDDWQQPIYVDGVVKGFYYCQRFDYVKKPPKFYVCRLDLWQVKV